MLSCDLRLKPNVLWGIDGNIRLATNHAFAFGLGPGRSGGSRGIDAAPGAQRATGAGDRVALLRWLERGRDGGGAQGLGAHSAARLEVRARLAPSRPDRKGSQ